MFSRLIFSNARHRPIRAVVSVLAVAVEVTLVIIIVGLTGGMMQEVGRRVQGVGADIMLQPPSSSVLLAFNGAPMPIKIRDRLETLKYVASVAPVLLQFNSSGGIDMVYGIDPDSFRAVSGGFVFHEGHDMETPDDMLVDDWAAKAKNIHVDQTYNLLSHDFHVAGIVEHGKGARIFIQLSTLQELTGARDKASLFFIKCTRPDHTNSVIDQMRDPFRGYEIRPLRDFLSLMSSTNIPGLNAFVTSMISLAIAIGFLVIFLSMYTTVMERTREIGVLKSLGASKGYVAKVFLSETAMICGAGIVVGIAMSFGLRAMLLSYFPTLAIQITAGWAARAAVIATVGGLIGAAYPAWVATRKDPLDSLFYS